MWIAFRIEKQAERNSSVSASPKGLNTCKASWQRPYLQNSAHGACTYVVNKLGETVIERTALPGAFSWHRGSRPLHRRSTQNDATVRGRMGFLLRLKQRYSPCWISSRRAGFGTCSDDLEQRRKRNEAGGATKMND